MEEKSNYSKNDSKEKYEPPKLKECGTIKENTNTTVGGSGTDTMGWS